MFLNRFERWENLRPSSHDISTINPFVAAGDICWLWWIFGSLRAVLSQSVDSGVINRCARKQQAHMKTTMKFEFEDFHAKYHSEEHLQETPVLIRHGVVVDPPLTIQGAKRTLWHASQRASLAVVSCMQLMFNPTVLIILIGDGMNVTLFYPIPFMRSGPKIHNDLA